MMDARQLVGENESKILEYKRDASSISGVLKTLVAFVNTAGGVLIIGIYSSCLILENF